MEFGCRDQKRPLDGQCFLTAVSLTSVVEKQALTDIKWAHLFAVSGNQCLRLAESNSTSVEKRP